MRYAIPIVIIVLALLGASSVYVVGAGHAAAVSQFGELQTVGVGPGLHLKLPFAQDVAIYDTRAITTQAEPGDGKTRDGDAVRVGFHLRWRIADPALFARAAAHDEVQATQQMEPLIRDALQKQVGQLDLPQLLAATDGDLGTRVREAVAGTIRAKFGIEVLAVGVGRVLPPEAALPSIYKRMNAEAEAAAGGVRAEGEAAAAAIRAQGDAADEQVLSVAGQAAAATRGEGDAQAAAIEAVAAAKDPQFFRYWSGLEAWRKSFGGGGAIVVIDKGSPFMQAVDSGAGSDNAKPGNR